MLQTAECFCQWWRQELIALAWHELEEEEKRGGQPFATLLRLRKEGGRRLGWKIIAAQLGITQGKKFTEGQVRQLAHRARRKLADFLVREVAHSLGLHRGDPGSTYRLKEELKEMGLGSPFWQGAAGRYR